MKIAIAAALATLAIAPAAFALEPVQGSIAPSATLEKAPAGSTLFNDFFADGHEVREVYTVNADHSVTLSSRVVINK